MREYIVYELGSDRRMLFLAQTAYQAMQKLIYMLNLSYEDETAEIQITKTGLHLYLEHNGNTYAVMTDGPQFAIF